MTMGRIHSIQSLGTVDGPGVRFVVFMQGCNLRCGCCHNPDSQSPDGGKEYEPGQMLEKILRYKEYFGAEGGVTLSGGEPILQPDFALRLFSLCHENGINTCLDTSGSILNEKIKALLSETDRVLLDIKYTNNADYLQYAGCKLDTVLNFLAYLDEKDIKTTLRQVTIPTLNDTKESILLLKKIADSHKCVDKVELLPFKKICQVKYDGLGIKFPFADIPIPTKETMKQLNAILKNQ